VTSGKIAPMHRILAVISIAGALWAREAAASCNLAGPYLGTGPQLPLGCPLHVYGGPSMDVLTPTVTVLRGGTYVDATGTYTMNLVDLQVERTITDCTGSFTNTQRVSEPYEHLAIPPINVQVGEQIGFGRGWFIGIAIVAAGTCPAPIVPMPTCTDMNPCFDEPPFEDFGPGGGCQARGGSGLGAGAALLGLLGRARRRRRR
jgi:hypothetical protein